MDKNLDNNGRWRSRAVSFRVSEEEAKLINDCVALSGLTKQDYIVRRLQCRDVVVQGNPRVYKALRNQMADIYEELRSSAPRVKRQLRRNDIAKVFFNNGYLSMVEDFPIDRLESCFEPVLKKNERFLRDVIREAGLSMEDITKVYLAGEEVEYPFVRKWMGEITQKSVCRINASQCAAARGAVLSGVN